ncbi:MAG: regulatory protein RecX [Bacteroidota bacterium]
MAEEILTKIYKYCTYQERCKSEVRKKLISLRAPEEDLEKILAHLERENFLNEMRFAQAYVRGKFIYKKWGRQKIRYELRGKQVPEELIEQAIAEEIDEESYEISMRKLIRQRKKQISDLSPFEKKAHLSKFLAQKGYENSEMAAVIKTFLEEE